MSQTKQGKGSTCLMMKALITILLSLTFFLGGCSSLLDGQFVAKDGKESPFKPKVNQHEPIQAPSYRD